MDFYLSEKNAKQLKEWGCDVSYSKLTTDTGCRLLEDSDFLNGEIHPNVKKHGIPTYHILEDICVKYSTEFFGPSIHGNIRTTKNILSLIQQDSKEEAEEYFLDNTIFNPSNQTL